MKTRLFPFVCYILVTVSSFADSYSIDVHSGLNIIANQLDHGSNTADEVMATVPDGTVLYKYDNGGSNWEVSAYSAAQGTWVPDNVTLNPGEGAFLQSPSNFTLMFTGTPHVPVLPVTIPNGACYLLSRQTNDIGNYTNIVGTAPVTGAQVHKWNGSNYDLYAFSTKAGWSPSEPIAAVGEAMWIAPAGGSPAPFPTNPVVVYQGLLNQALGGATLDLNTQSNQLTIGNIGSSGEDGVEIALSPGEAWEAHWESLDSADQLPVGAHLQSQVVGTTASITNQVLASWEMTKMGTSNYAVTADFSPIGASTVTLEVYDGTNLVATTNGQSGTLCFTTSCVNDDHWGNPTPTVPFTGYWGGGGLTMFGPRDVTFPGGWIAQGDRLVIIPEGGDAVTSLSAVRLLASGIPQIVITNERAILTVGAYHNAALDYVQSQGLWFTNSARLTSNQVVEVANSIADYLKSVGFDPTETDLSVTSVLQTFSDESMFYSDSGEVYFGAPVVSDKVVPYMMSQLQARGAVSSVFVEKVDAVNDMVVNQDDPLVVLDYVTNTFPGSFTNAADHLAAEVFVDTYTHSYDYWPNQSNSLPLLKTKIKLPKDDKVILADAAGSAAGLPLGGIGSIITGAASSIVANHLLRNKPAISLGYKGRDHNAEGTGGLDISFKDLVVNNLQTNTSFGVSIPLNSGEMFAAHWDDLDPDNAVPTGAYLQFNASGSGGSVSNGLLSSVQVTKLGTSNYVVTANAPVSGTNTFTLRVYNGTNLMASKSGLSGTLCTVPRFPGDGEWGPGPYNPIPPFDPIGGGPIVGITWDFPTGPLLVAIAGGPSVMGDAVIVVPDDYPTVSSLTGVQLLADEISQIVVTNESVSFNYAALTHTALGDATLSLIANQLDHGSNPVVYVSNIGSSGQDGVSIALNPGNNFAGTWLPLDPSNALPVGAYVQNQMVGTSSNVTNGVLGWTRCTKTGTSNYVISVDYSPLGSSVHTVQVYNGSVLVAQVTGQTNSICATVKLPPWICTINPWLNYEWPTPIDIAVNGGPDVMGTEILMIPEDGAAVSSITAEQILAANIPSITITNESVSVNYAGLTETPVGNASLSVIVNQLDHGSNTYPDDVYIGNLGSNGEDGVSITLPSDLGALDMNWQPLDASNSLPVGAYVQEQLVGTAGAVSNGLLGTVTMTKAGTSNYVVSADFSPIGASNYTVQAYLNGMMVTQATNQVGAMLASCQYWGDSGCIPLPPILGGGWDRTNWLVGIGGGPAVLCDHLYVMPENVSGTQTVFRMVASQVTSLTITSVAVSPLLVHMSRTGPDLMLHWYGTSVLQESTDLATWTDATNATSPYAVHPPTNGPAKFYRLVFRP